jgi:hypothetical protein
MSIWTWIVIAAFSWIGFSLLIGLPLARVLWSIRHPLSNILDAEAEAGVFAPLARGIEEGSGIEAKVAGSRADCAQLREPEFARALAEFARAL